MHRWGCLAAAAILVVALTTSAQGELRAPRAGTALKWTCEGPYGTGYALSVARIKDGLVRYEDPTDPKLYWVELGSRFTGTSLWNRKIGDQLQWFHEDEFTGLEKLVPGSRYRGAVPAVRGYSSWVWDYEVHVDQPVTVQNAVLGSVTLSPVVESRKIYHGTYWSKMTSLVLPELGITVRWTFEDGGGIERCDLADLKQPSTN